MRACLGSPTPLLRAAATYIKCINHHFSSKQKGGEFFFSYCFFYFIFLLGGVENERDLKLSGDERAIFRQGFAATYLYYKTKANINGVLYLFLIRKQKL